MFRVIVSVKSVKCWWQTVCSLVVPEVYFAAVVWFTAGAFQPQRQKSWLAETSLGNKRQEKTGYKKTWKSMFGPCKPTFYSLIPCSASLTVYLVVLATLRFPTCGLKDTGGSRLLMMIYKHPGNLKQDWMSSFHDKQSKTTNLNLIMFWSQWNFSVAAFVWTQSCRQKQDCAYIYVHGLGFSYWSWSKTWAFV